MAKRKQLLDQLMTLRQNDPYPFHMPGHKRMSFPFPEAYSIDITEIDGFDNLHQPQGLLKDLSERYARLYDCDFCNLSVGGSTDMLLTVISAATAPGDRVLIARNCHKAVYHAAILRHLECAYIYPPLSEEGICGPVDPKELSDRLTELEQADQPVKAFVLTSPTYEGVCSDVKEIANICHAHEVTLIVDGAHGAHLGLRKDKKRLEEYFPENPIREGADAVVVSLHKNLPSFTQTAALLMNGESRIPKWRVETYFDYYETSSPSYLLMAGMDACCKFLEEQGEKAFCEYAHRIKKIRKAAESFTGVSFWKKDGWEIDPGKLVITAKGLTGNQIMEEFRREDHLELEMCSLNHALAMTSVMDTEEGYERLKKAMERLDSTPLAEGISCDTGWQTGGGLYNVRPRIKRPIFCSETEPIHWVSLEEAAGRVAGGLWSVYPPGIPLLVPGEIVSDDIIRKLKTAQKEGLTLDGCRKNGDFPVIL